MDFEKCIKYICRLRLGTLAELRNDIGKKNLSIIKSTGFIHIGYNIIDNKFTETWHVTKSADDYYKAMYGGVISRM